MCSSEELLSERMEAFLSSRVPVCGGRVGGRYGYLEWLLPYPQFDLCPSYINNDIGEIHTFIKVIVKLGKHGENIQHTHTYTM